MGAEEFQIPFHIRVVVAVGATVPNSAMAVSSPGTERHQVCFDQLQMWKIMERKFVMDLEETGGSTAFALREVSEELISATSPPGRAAMEFDLFVNRPQQHVESGEVHLPISTGSHL